MLKLLQREQIARIAVPAIASHQCREFATACIKELAQVSFGVCASALFAQAQLHTEHQSHGAYSAPYVDHHASLAKATDAFSLYLLSHIG